MLKRIGVVFDHVLDASVFLAGIIVAWQTFSVSANTLLRYLFNSPVTGVEGVTEYGILWLTFLSAAWLLKKDKHIKVDLVLNQLKPKAQAAIDAASSAVAIVLCLILLYYSIQVEVNLWVTWDVDPFKIAHFPKAVPVTVIPFGFFLLTIQFIRRLIQDISHIRKPPPRTESQAISEEAL